MLRLGRPPGGARARTTLAAVALLCIATTAAHAVICAPDAATASPFAHVNDPTPTTTSCPESQLSLAPIDLVVLTARARAADPQFYRGATSGLAPARPAPGAAALTSLDLADRALRWSASNDDDDGRRAPTPSATPLPASGWLLLASLGSLAALGTRRRHAWPTQRYASRGGG